VLRDAHRDTATIVEPYLKQLTVEAEEVHDQSQAADALSATQTKWIA
jgi:hypothetical protein